MTGEEGGEEIGRQHLVSPGVLPNRPRGKNAAPGWRGRTVGKLVVARHCGGSRRSRGEGEGKWWLRSKSQGLPLSLRLRNAGKKRRPAALGKQRPLPFTVCAWTVDLMHSRFSRGEMQVPDGWDMSRLGSAVSYESVRSRWPLGTPIDLHHPSPSQNQKLNPHPGPPSCRMACHHPGPITSMSPSSSTASIESGTASFQKSGNRSRSGEGALPLASKSGTDEVFPWREEASSGYIDSR